MSYQTGIRLPDEDIIDPTFPSQPAGPSTAPSSTNAERVNKYETTLSMRLDIEAALCYVLGPLTGVLFLILETKNDYVRFHAWQSSLVFTAVLSCHVFFSIFSATLAGMLFAFELALIAWLAYQAFINADNLDRYQLIYFGPIASQWVDSE